MTGDQLALRAKQQIGYDVSYSGDALEIFAQIQYVGERPDTDFQTFTPTMLDSYTKANLSASYTFSDQWQIKFKIDDVFDESPTLVSGYRSGGREFYMTLVHQD